MKAHLLATVSILTLVGSAPAADLLARMPTKVPPPVAPFMNWTGFYIGLNGGAAWLHTDANVIDAVGTYAGSVKPTGATFGGQMGYNWQFQNFVLGLEGDLNWVNAKERGSIYGSLFLESKLSALGTVRGRAGVLVAPAALLYVTGGYAVGHLAHDTDLSGGFTDHSTKSGWTAGGGLEYMVAPQWTVKAEALYVDFGTSTVPNQYSGYSASFKDTATIARVGANFKF